MNSEPKQPAAENSSPIVHLTKKDFLTKVVNYETNPEEWIYLGDKPAIIDFYAVWCGPCKMLSPVLEEIASLYAGKIQVYKVDVDKEPELASVFGINSVPTLIFAPLNQPPHLAQGALPKNQLIEAIDNILLK